MRLNDIIKAISTCEIIGGVDIDVTGIQMDSRLVEEGNMFVAVKGTQTDGHAYIEKANWLLHSTVTLHRNLTW